MAQCIRFAFVLLAMTVSAGIARRPTWTVARFDSSAARASPVELVKTADGRILAFYDGGNEFVRAACRTDSGWTITDAAPGKLPEHQRSIAAAGPSGELCFSCYTRGDTWRGWLVHWDGDSWWREPYPLEQEADLAMGGAVAFDSSGRLHTAAFGTGDSLCFVERDDSGWTRTVVCCLSPREHHSIALSFGADRHAWLMAYVWWQFNPRIEYSTLLLLRRDSTGWSCRLEQYNGHTAALAVVAHGDSVSHLRGGCGLTICDDDTLLGIEPDCWQRGGLCSVSDSLLLAACVPLGWTPPDTGAAMFAYRTNRWHVEALPGPAAGGGIDVEVDALGRPVVVWSTTDGGIWCAVGDNVVSVDQPDEVRPGRAGPVGAGVRRAPVRLALPGGDVEVVGSAGQLVRSLSGPDALEWDGRDNRGREVPAGVYFIRAVGAARPSARVVLVR